MARALFSFTNRNKWLGQPATAKDVVPGVSGLAQNLSKRGWNLADIILQNTSGGSAAVALVGLLPDAAWEAGQWVHATTTYTGDTVDAQDADTNDFPLETTTVDDGLIIGADVPFGAVSVDVTTAGSGTTPTHVVEYWNGSAWTAVAAVGMLSDVPRSADWAAAEELILFNPPVDWAKGGSGTGVNANRYNLRIRRTNATQATAALARRLYVGVVLFSEDAVAANGKATKLGQRGMAPSYVTGIHGAFSVVDEGNTATFTYG